MIRRSLLLVPTVLFAIAACVALGACVRVKAEAARRIEECRKRECALILAVDRLTRASRQQPPALYAVR